MLNLQLRLLNSIAKTARITKRQTLKKFAPLFCSNLPRALFSEAKAEKMEFKAETKRLLDIVAKSLYTDSEVFIR